MMTWIGYAGALSLVLAGASLNRTEAPVEGPAAETVVAPAPMAVVHGGDTLQPAQMPNEGGGGCGAPAAAPSGGCGAPAPAPEGGGCGGH